MKMTFNLMDRSGHSTEVFDKNDEAAMAKAEALFEKETKKGNRLAESPPREAGNPDPQVVSDFNPKAGSYIQVRPIQGG